MRMVLLTLLLALAAGTVTGCADEAPLPPPLAPPQRGDIVRVVVGSMPLRVRVVATHADRQRGMMGVRELADGKGMLFVYPKPERRQFWMKGCLIPLDIAFLDAEGRVVQIDTLQPPGEGGGNGEETRLSPPAVFALETRAGFFASNGFEVGTRVRIPPTVDPTKADP